MNSTLCKCADFSPRRRFLPTALSFFGVPRVLPAPIPGVVQKELFFTVFLLTFLGSNGILYV